MIIAGQNAAEGVARALLVRITIQMQSLDIAAVVQIMSMAMVQNIILIVHPKPLLYRNLMCILVLFHIKKVTDQEYPFLLFRMYDRMTPGVHVCYIISTTADSTSYLANCGRPKNSITFDNKYLPISVLNNYGSGNLCLSTSMNLICNSRKNILKQLLVLSRSATIPPEGNTKKQTRIVNGDRANDFDWPWQVGLRHAQYK